MNNFSMEGVVHTNKKRLEASALERIRELMFAAGMTQQDLATAIGASQSTISRLLSGDEEIGMARFRRIASALKTTTYALMAVPEPQGAPTTYSSIAAELLRLGMQRDEVFERAGFFKGNPDRKCIGTTLSIQPLRGAEGLPAEMVDVQSMTSSVQLPTYVTRHLPKIQTELEGNDRNKVALIGWKQRPIDVDGGRLHLQLAPIKYSAKLAMRAAGEKLLDDVIEGRVRILDDAEALEDWPVARFPCHLHCDGLVLLGDGHVLLAQRGDHVEIEPMKWAASFGESMDWDEDRDATGALHPFRTVLRGLDEELGLAEDWMRERFGDTGTITFLELNFQLDNFVYFFTTLIELPRLGIAEALDRARNFRKDKETRAFASLDFTLADCVNAVVSGHANGKPLINAARLSLLLAAVNKFGSAVVDELASRAVKP